MTVKMLDKVKRVIACELDPRLVFFIQREVRGCKGRREVGGLKQTRTLDLDVNHSQRLDYDALYLICMHIKA